LVIEEPAWSIQALKSRNPHAARLTLREHLQRVIQGLLAATELEAVEPARTEVAAKRSEYARRSAI
jgi:GntR family transcriptional regulator, hexuronate regulon transcriptional repressor